MAAAATTPNSSDHHDAHAPAGVPEVTVDVGRIRRLAIVAAVVGLLAFAGLAVFNYVTDPVTGTKDVFLTYTCGFIFWASVPLGSLGLMMIGFLTSASWGVILRRIFQASIRTLPILALLGLPMLGGVFMKNLSPYWWADPTWTKGPEVTPLSPEEAKQLHDLEEKEHDAKLSSEEAKQLETLQDREHAEEAVNKIVAQTGDKDLALSAAALHTKLEVVEEGRHKIHDYLNPTFFSFRYFTYFVLVALLGYAVMAVARPIEERSDLTKKRGLLAISGFGVLVWVLGLTVVATDWVMSVEPTWASSMFPVIFGMNQFLTTLTFSTLVLYSVVKAVPGQPNPANLPDLSGILKDKFRIDIGSLTLGFCMVWAYASFCQFMLIWAGNLPEEITYYLKRGAGNEDSILNGIGGGPTGNASGWIYLTYVLMAFHWLLPFIVLLFREVKTSPKGMKVMTTLLLTVCACDVIWWLLPSIPHEKTWLHFPMAVAAIVGVGGVWALFFSWELAKKPILVVNTETQFLADWGHH